MTRPIPRVKSNRRTTGSSELYKWRQRLKLTQRAVCTLLGIGDSTIQRWDAHEDSAPPLLDPAMRYHELMRLECRVIENKLDQWDRATLSQIKARGESYDVVEELRRENREGHAALIENIQIMTPATEAALLYGLEHALF